jgi:hypothetical protein
MKTTTGKFLASIIFALFFSLNLLGQNIDSLQLTAKEIPENYSISSDNNCISIQARMLFDNPGIYQMIIGKVKNKLIQSFESKKESGCIIYFEFESEFKAKAFLEGLLWGESKPSKEHPEEYFSKGNFLVIWSFKKGSLIKKVSEEKINSLLK